MSKCGCGRDMGNGNKDGERRSCISCGKQYEWVQEAGMGCYWVPAIRRIAPEDRPEGYLNKRIHRRMVEAQSIGHRAKERR